MMLKKNIDILKNNWKSLVYPGLLLAVIVYLFVYHIKYWHHFTSAPFVPIHHDGCRIAIASLYMMKFKTIVLSYLDPFEPPLAYFIMIPFFILLGPSIATIKIGLLVYGLMARFLLFAASRNLYGKWMALVVFSLVSVSTVYATLFSLFVEYSIIPTIIALSIFFYSLFNRYKKIYYLVLASFFFGFALWAKISLLQLYLVFGIAFLLFKKYKDFSLNQRWVALVSSLVPIVFLVLLMPTISIKEKIVSISGFSQSISERVYSMFCAVHLDFILTLAIYFIVFITYNILSLFHFKKRNKIIDFLGIVNILGLLVYLFMPQHMSSFRYSTIIPLIYIGAGSFILLGKGKWQKLMASISVIIILAYGYIFVLPIHNLSTVSDDIPKATIHFLENTDPRKSISYQAEFSDMHTFLYYANNKLDKMQKENHKQMRTFNMQNSDRFAHDIGLNSITRLYPDKPIEYIIDSLLKKGIENIFVMDMLQGVSGKAFLNDAQALLRRKSIDFTKKSFPAVGSDSITLNVISIKSKI